MKIQHLYVALASFATIGAASAQSSIECHPNGAGHFQAALIWQNTLGVERANAICNMHADRLGLNQAAAQAVIGNAQQHASPPMSTQERGRVATPHASGKMASRNSAVNRGSSRFDSSVVNRAYATIGNQPSHANVAPVKPSTAATVEDGYLDLAELAAQPASDTSPERYEKLF